MKRKATITLIVILAVAGVISYGIIWYRKRTSTPSTGSGTAADKSNTSSTNKITVPGSGKALPGINSYGWWTNRLGHAQFPLGLNSKGVEVLKVQEVLNFQTVKQKINLGKISEDGIWGPETQSRFKLIFPEYDNVNSLTFSLYIDPENQLTT